MIFEKEEKPGGQINIADKPPHKEKIDWIVEYELKQLAMKGISVKTGTEATPESVKAISPYAVMIATGAESIRPQSIKGVNNANVLTVDEALLGKPEISGKKVLLIGSGATGLETAEFLCSQGNDVTVAEMLDAIGKGVYVQHYLDAMDKLSRYDVKYLPGHKLTEITEEGAVLEDLKENKNVAIAADYIVLSLGVRPVNTLEAECKKFCGKTFAVGDASKPGRVESAVREGFEAAWNLK